MILFILLAFPSFQSFLDLSSIWLDSFFAVANTHKKSVVALSEGKGIAQVGIVIFQIMSKVIE